MTRAKQEDEPKASVGKVVETPDSSYDKFCRLFKTEIKKGKFLIWKQDNKNEWVKFEIDENR